MPSDVAARIVDGVTGGPARHYPGILRRTPEQPDGQ